MTRGSAFMNRGYGCLCAIRFSTSLVAWIDFVLIFSTLTFVFHSNTQTLGLAAACYGLPSLLLGPVAGRLSDRANPFVLIASSFVLRGIASYSLYVATDADIFVLCVLFKGFSNLGATPAEVVLTRRLLTDEAIIRNTATISVVNQVIKVCSPLAAGLVASSAHRPIGFLLSALCSFAGLMFCVNLWRLQGSNVASSARRSTAPGSFAALKQLYGSGPVVRVLLFASLAQSAVLGFYDSMLGKLLQTLALGPSAFGLVVSATGLGGVCAGIAFRRLYPAGIVLCSTIALFCYGALIVLCAMVALSGTSHALMILLALFFFSGAACGLTSMTFAVVLQNNCPPAHLGFVSSTVWSLTLALLVSGPVLGGLVAGLTSIETAFVAAGTAAMVLGLALHLKYARAMIRSLVAD